MAIDKEKIKRKLEKLPPKIIQATFSIRNGKRNWCYEEFSKFNKFIKQHEDIGKRHFWLLAFDKKQIFNGLNLSGNDDYIKWIDNIKKSKYIVIDGLRPKDFQTVINELSEEIIKVKDNFLKAYLGPFAD